MPKPRTLPTMPLRTHMAKYLWFSSATSELNQPTSGAPGPLAWPMTVCGAPAGSCGFGVATGKSSPMPTLKKAFTRPSKLKRQPSFSTRTTSAEAVRQNASAGSSSPKQAKVRCSLLRLFTRSPRRLSLLRLASCLPMEGRARVDVVDDLLLGLEVAAYNHGVSRGVDAGARRTVPVGLKAEVVE